MSATVHIGRESFVNHFVEFSQLVVTAIATLFGSTQFCCLFDCDTL